MEESVWYEGGWRCENRSHKQPHRQGGQLGSGEGIQAIEKSENSGKYVFPWLRGLM